MQYICKKNRMTNLIVGTVAFDAIETPYGKTDKIVGGAATYISLAASFFTDKLNLVSVVGGDFPQSAIKMLHDHSVDTAGLQRLLIDASGNISTPNGDNGLGLGTDTIPHGGVGAAKLAIEGSDSNFGAGPHVQFTTTGDDHPLMQILPYAHDNVSISFDAL